MSIAAALGFVIGYFAYKYLAAALGSLTGLILSVVVVLVWWLFMAMPFADAMASVIPLDLVKVASRDFGGFMLSITIGVVAIGCSLPIGIVLALGRQSDLFIVKTLCVALSSSSAACR